MRRTWMVFCLACIAVAFLWVSHPADAAVDVDLRAGDYTDSESAFVGGGVLTNVSSSKRWFFNPNVELVFPDRGDIVTVNGDFHYDFAGGERFTYWLGGGPAVLFVDQNGGDTNNDFGVNLLAGMGAMRGDVRPFVQGKVTLADDTQAIVAVGIRF